MAPSKKRKVRREERKPEPVELTPLPKQDEEDEEQVDYEASEEIHHQQQQQQIQQQQQQQQHQGHREGSEYDDPEEDPDAEDAGGEDSSDDHENGQGGEDGDEDGDEDEEDEGDIDNLLEPLSKEQLISLLRAAAAFDPRTRAEIRRAADQDPALRRIFVHGISYSTSADTLRSFFAQYGDVDECRIITDRVTGKSKGYGFIVFRHGSSARRALKEPQKFIDGRMTACQMATVGPAAAPPVAVHQPPPAAPSHAQPSPYHTPQDVLPRKIFVGNVNPDVDKDRLVQFFSQYGEIEEGPLGFDRQTGKAKGYALFIYKTVEAARRALQEPNKNFDGRLLYCQKATDSQRAKAAAAAAAAASGATPTPGPVTPDVQGNMGYNVAPGSAMAFPGAMDMGLAQGFLSAALPFAQGMQANPAALAMLAAAGQNPAAFGVPPAMIASLNPALAAAAMNQGSAPVVPPAQVPPVQGYSMGGSAGYQNVGYQGPPPQQSGGSYQGPPMAPVMRPTAGPMGGYGPH